MKYWLLPLVLGCSLAGSVLGQGTEEDMDDVEFEDPAMLPVPAEPSAAEREAAAAAQLSGARTLQATGATLRGLDKVTGRTADIQLANGQATNFGRLQILLSECRFPQENPNSDAFAELTIIDTSKNTRLFAGWMLASAPALSALDDARYDVWVISCNNA